MDHKREYWRDCKGSSGWALASEGCEMLKDTVADLVSGLFGLPAKMAVERGLAEFRAGRPVLFAAESSVIAVPVDALDAEGLHSFVGTFASSADALPPRLAVTARAPRALGTPPQRPLPLPVVGTDALPARPS